MRGGRWLRVDRSSSRCSCRCHGGHELATAVARVRRRWLDITKIATIEWLNRRLVSAGHGPVARRLIVDSSERERNYSSSSSHIRLSQLPVHRFGCSPGDSQFFSHFGPHIRFESLIEPSKLILAFLIPLTASFEIVLVVKPTADGTASRKSLGNVLPLHASPTELDNDGILFGRPLALFLDWLVWNVRCHTAPIARDERRNHRQRPYTRREEVMRSSRRS